VVEGALAAVGTGVAQTLAGPTPRAGLYHLVHHRAVEVMRVSEGACPAPSTAATREVQLLEAMRALSVDQRAALLLREGGDLSHEELAHVLDLRPALARKLLVHARMALADRLVGAEPAPSRLRRRSGDRLRGLLRR